MDSPGVVGSVRLQTEPTPCSQCGSTSRVGRGLCLKCLLYRGLGEETYDNETLENVLDEIDVKDADWHLGNYQILDEIGRGGMGVIYRARQRHSRRIVALKRILAYHSDSRETLVRFRREAEAAASLDHPNILPIYEVGEADDGLPYFSMKLATGGSLLESEFALQKDPRRAVTLMAKVSRAVQYAHAHGILHRDLKPGNILLDGHGEPMVSDFGLAKWLEANSDLTRTLTIFGTPGYIAPEQAHGPAANLKATADVYSLGAILFDLLAGRPPFLGEHALSVIQQAKDKTAPRLRALKPTLDRDLETVCARCLEREPNARYHSAGDLAEDLERWLEGRPVMARPVPPAVRVWRWARRNPKLAASVTGSIVGAIAITTFAVLTLGPTGSRLRMLPIVSEKSVAVLPFQNLSEEKQDALLANGVHDEILNDLAKIAELKVISRTSAMQYGYGSGRDLREIARDLRVAHIVQGTVQRVGGRVRVTAQLTDTRTETQLWGEHYDRQLSDVFSLESELAEQIALKLRAKLSPQEKSSIEQQPTKDLSAYDLYVRAKNLVDMFAFSTTGKENLLEAVRLLDNAVEKDPTFLLAYYHLARVHDLLYFLGIDRTEDRLGMANSAVQAMIRLRPDAGETRLALAQHLYSARRDYEQALSELTIARGALPNEPFVFVLAAQIARRQGDWDKSAKNLEQALQLDPRNVFILQIQSYNYEALGLFNEMAATLDRIVSINPNDVNARLERAWVDLISRANPAPLHSAIGAAIAENPGIAPSISRYWMYLALWERDNSALERALAVLPADGCRDDLVPFPRAWCEGLAARSSGNTAAAQAAFIHAKAEALELLQKQPNYAEGLCVLGMIDAALGNKDLAIREGRRAVELLPPTADSYTGTKLNQYLAIIYAWTGEKELALDELERLMQLSRSESYGSLYLDPYWDPLRGDQRFEKIVSSLAPDGKKP